MVTGDPLNMGHVDALIIIDHRLFLNLYTTRYSAEKIDLGILFHLLCRLLHVMWSERNSLISPLNKGHNLKRLYRSDVYQRASFG